MQIQPYLIFNGRCDEALAFYKKAVGAEVGMLMRYKESPVPTESSAAWANKVMHAAFSVGSSTLFATDGREQGEDRKFEGFMLSITAADAAEARKLYAALAEGGKAEMPIEKTFFSPAFGMLTDRFGLRWMVIVQQSGR
jgi:PhnB protein